MFGAGVALILAISFLVVYSLPGDPARMILGPRADAQTVARFRATAGLDSSILVQFERFTVRIAKLDFGDSLTERRPVIDLIRERSRYTLELILYSMGTLLLFGILVPLGLLALRLDWADATIRAFWTILAAAPAYVLSLVTLTLFAGLLEWIPAIFEPMRPLCWVAPALILAVYPTSLVSRLFRNALESSLNSDYAFRARAQGFSEPAIILREALVNSVTAPVSAFANGLAYFVTGTFFVEVAFGIGGLGTLTYESIRNKDVTVLAGVCLFFALLVSMISALLDLAQHLLDPLLRRSHESVG
jgi:ABC-type dipeptide/oligopeptide/nickel transport system permease component